MATAEVERPPHAGPAAGRGGVGQLGERGQPLRLGQPRQCARLPGEGGRVDLSAGGGSAGQRAAGSQRGDWGDGAAARLRRLV